MSRDQAAKGQSSEAQTVSGPLHLIALGANLPSESGRPRETLEAALTALQARGLGVAAQSAWYGTPAFPAGSGPDYVNGAAALASPLSPDAVLELLHEVERDLGRSRAVRWGPRVCDLDLLACGDTVLPDAAMLGDWIARSDARRMETPPGLLLPHPRLHERGFVLRPLADVAPDWRHPLLGLTVPEMLAALPPDALEGIVRL